MAGSVYQNEGAQDPRLGKWHGQQGLLKGQSNLSDRIGGQLCGVFFRQIVDVQAVYHALNFGFDPAVTVQSPLNAA